MRGTPRDQREADGPAEIRVRHLVNWSVTAWIPFKLEPSGFQATTSVVASVRWPHVFAALMDQIVQASISGTI
jgi:hypothetical protein